MRRRQQSIYMELVAVSCAARVLGQLLPALLAAQSSASSLPLYSSWTQVQPHEPARAEPGEGREGQVVSCQSSARVNGALALLEGIDQNEADSRSRLIVWNQILLYFFFFSFPSSCKESERRGSKSWLSHLFRLYLLAVCTICKPKSATKCMC